MFPIHPPHTEKNIPNFSSNVLYISFFFTPTAWAHDTTKLKEKKEKKITL